MPAHGAARALLNCRTDVVAEGPSTDRPALTLGRRAVRESSLAFPFGWRGCTTASGMRNGTSDMHAVGATLAGFADGVRRSNKALCGSSHIAPDVTMMSNSRTDSIARHIPSCSSDDSSNCFIPTVRGTNWLPKLVSFRSAVSSQILENRNCGQSGGRVLCQFGRPYSLLVSTIPMHRYSRSLASRQPQNVPNIGR